MILSAINLRKICYPKFHGLGKILLYVAFSISIDMMIPTAYVFIACIMDYEERIIRQIDQLCEVKRGKMSIWC